MISMLQDCTVSGSSRVSTYYGSQTEPLAQVVKARLWVQVGEAQGR